MVLCIYCKEDYGYYVDLIFSMSACGIQLQIIVMSGEYRTHVASEESSFCVMVDGNVAVVRKA